MCVSPSKICVSPSLKICVQASSVQHRIQPYFRIFRPGSNLMGHPPWGRRPDVFLSGRGATTLSGRGATPLSGRGATPLTGRRATPLLGRGATPLSGWLSGRGATPLTDLVVASDPPFISRPQHSYVAIRSQFSCQLKVRMSHRTVSSRSLKVIFVFEALMLRKCCTESGSPG